MASWTVSLESWVQVNTSHLSLLYAAYSSWQWDRWLMRVPTPSKWSTITVIVGRDGDSDITAIFCSPLQVSSDALKMGPVCRPEQGLYSSLRPSEAPCTFCLISDHIKRENPVYFFSFLPIEGPLVLLGVLMKHFRYNGLSNLPERGTIYRLYIPQNQIEFRAALRLLCSCHSEPARGESVHRKPKRAHEARLAHV